MLLWLVIITHRLSCILRGGQATSSVSGRCLICDRGLKGESCGETGYPGRARGCCAGRGCGRGEARGSDGCSGISCCGSGGGGGTETSDRRQVLQPRIGEPACLYLC